jgi:hypothetical protein
MSTAEIADGGKVEKESLFLSSFLWFVSDVKYQF